MRAIILLPAVGLFSAATAQITFERTYTAPGAPINLGSSVQQTMDGGYILAGGSDLGTGSGIDVALLKVDAYGELQWMHTYGSTLFDMAYCVREVSVGGYILAGVFSGFGNDTLALVRTDAAGEVIWERRFSGGLGRDIGYNVVETSDGGFAVCGFTGADPQLDALVIRVDADGELLWTRAFDLGATEYANAIRHLPDGGFIVLCDNGELGGLGEGVIHLLGSSADGDLTWNSVFSANEGLSARGLCVNSDGGFTIAGTVGYPHRDVILIRSDAQGEELWRRVYGAPGMDETAMDVQQLPDGGFIVCGRKEVQTNDIRMHLFRTDADGMVLWERTWAHGFMNEALSLDSTTDDGFVLFGHSTDTIGGGLSIEMYLVKTDGNGFTNITEVPSPWASMLLAPVPANDRLSVTICGTAPRKVQLLDASGRVIREQSWRQTSVEWIPVHDLAPGGYFLSIVDELDRRSTRRFVVAR